MGGNGIAPILTTILIIGALTAYWFWAASTFLNGNIVNMAQTSLLPVVCSINADRASDIRTSASIFFWHGIIHIDVQMVGGKTPFIAHEFINGARTGYIWQDGNPNGDIVKDVSDYPLLNNIPAKNTWFCFPNIFFDPSKFTLPTGINFNPLIN